MMLRNCTMPPQRPSHSKWIAEVVIDVPVSRRAGARRSTVASSLPVVPEQLQSALVERRRTSVDTSPHLHVSTTIGGVVIERRRTTVVDRHPSRRKDCEKGGKDREDIGGETGAARPPSRAHNVPPTRARRPDMTLKGKQRHQGRLQASSDISIKSAVNDDSSSDESESPVAHEQNRRLCPFCDGPWPEHPSKRLEYLLKYSLKKAWRAPRPGNPHHVQTAHMRDFMWVCNQHHAETKYVPIGLARGWPTRIDFNSLAARLERHKDELASIVRTPTSSSFYRLSVEHLEKLGARFAGSLAGQFQTFTKWHAGYYGEQGQEALSSALLILLGGFSQLQSARLRPDVFLHQVLIPEAATMLIREDCQVTASEALDIYKESRNYGLALFPADLGDSDPDL